MFDFGVENGPNLNATFHSVLCVDCTHSCPPCSAAAGLHCSHYGIFKPMKIDMLHDGGCRAAVTRMDKVNCGTPSFKESLVTFPSTLTMIPTHSDICWYKTGTSLPGKHQAIVCQWHIDLHSPNRPALVHISEERVSNKCLKCLSVMGNQMSVYKYVNKTVYCLLFTVCAGLIRVCHAMQYNATGCPLACRHVRSGSPPSGVCIHLHKQQLHLYSRTSWHGLR